MIAAILCWISDQPFLCRIFGHKERRLTRKEMRALHELASATSHHQGLDKRLSARKRVCRRCEATRFTRERKKAAR